MRICAAAMVWLTSSVAIAEPTRGRPADEATDAQIRAAIVDLDHAQYRVRAAAAKTLLAAGPTAIEPLARAARSGSVETAHQAMRILGDLALDGNVETAQATRDMLESLAKSKSQAREPAREILKRRRGQALDSLISAGARVQSDSDKVRAIYLDSVDNLSDVLPLLRELPEIEEVSLSNAKFGDAGMKELLPLKNLRWLNLYHSNIGDEALKYLKYFPKLESVPMGHTHITDKGLVHIADLTQLEYVGLRGNDITDAGLVHLKKLTQLTGLTLQETKITGARFDCLSAMTSLGRLRLQHTAVGDAELAKLHGLSSLRHIELGGTNTTREGILKLRQAIPELNVILVDDQ